MTPLLGGQLIELLLELAVLRRLCQERSNDAETEVRPAFVRSVGLRFVVHLDAEFFVFPPRWWCWPRLLPTLAEVVSRHPERG